MCAVIFIGGEDVGPSTALRFAATDAPHSFSLHGCMENAKDAEITAVGGCGNLWRDFQSSCLSRVGKKGFLQVAGPRECLAGVWGLRKSGSCAGVVLGPSGIRNAPELLWPKFGLSPGFRSAVGPVLYHNATIIVLCLRVWMSVLCR